MFAFGILLSIALVSLGLTLWAPLTYAANATGENLENPVLSVETIRLEEHSWPSEIKAYGEIAAWQESSVGNETTGLRLKSIHAEIGDLVEQGQILAEFDAELVRAELAQQQAAVSEAEAALEEAKQNAQRARHLVKGRALSEQQTQQYLTAEQTAQARLASAKAAEAVQKIRLAQTQLRAPDAGVITSRTATIGAVLPAGEELFRLIRRNKLEWRAEVADANLHQISNGLQAKLFTPTGQKETGVVRVVSPTVDPQTRNALVYVDLADNTELKQGMFTQGAIEIKQTSAYTLPQSAITMRDGYSYIMSVSSSKRVVANKVKTGRRQSDKIEILELFNGDTARPINASLVSQLNIIKSGGEFLAHGDLVRIVTTSNKDALAGSTEGQRREF
ncbi:Nickel and cobalt resistance protein CnrB [Thalassocella blandensis]|nr:Nickel and cobalt resistance protein CnrB [Thalassocella blandensis]